MSHSQIEVIAAPILKSLAGQTNRRAHYSTPQLAPAEGIATHFHFEENSDNPEVF